MPYCVVSAVLFQSGYVFLHLYLACSDIGEPDLTVMAEYRQAEYRARSILLQRRTTTPASELLRRVSYHVETPIEGSYLYLASV